MKLQEWPNSSVKGLSTTKCISWENVLSNNNSAESYNEFFDLFANVYEKNFPLTKKIF
jgi:hypothetical protein